MDDFQQSSMVALLPTTTDWCHIDLPHLTIVYAGEINQLSPGTFNELAKVASDISLSTPPLFLRVFGVEIFGDEDKVDVLRVQASQDLLNMRAKLERYNKSEYKVFKPHCTVGPAGTADGNVPAYLGFDRIMVGWGDENVTFWLDK